MKMTSDRWAANAAHELPDAGDVVYFIHLHLDTVELKGPHPYKKGEWKYTVDGKPRPMLVLQSLSEQAYGKGRRFKVLRFTTKNLDGKGNPRKNVIPMGRCIDPDTDSFLVAELLWLPQKLLHGKPGATCVLRRFDPLEFGNILRCLTTNHLMVSKP
jgi:hypothetical protein